MEGIEPVEEAPLTVEEQYFQDVSDGLNVTNAIFANFGAIFTSSYETRQLLIDALLEGGDGSAFNPTVEALESILPPDQFAEGHQILPESHLELQRLGQEAVQVVRDGDMAGFVLINGQLAEVGAMVSRSLPDQYCRRLYEGSTVSEMCGPYPPPPEGEYRGRFSKILREFQLAFVSVMRSFGFPVSLTSEENLTVVEGASPKAALLLEELRTQMVQLETPAEAVEDHELLIQTIDGFLEIFARACPLRRRGTLSSTSCPLSSPKGRSANPRTPSHPFSSAPWSRR